MSPSMASGFRWWRGQSPCSAPWQDSAALRHRHRAPQGRQQSPENRGRRSRPSPSLICAAAGYSLEIAAANAFMHGEHITRPKGDKPMIFIGIALLIAIGLALMISADA